MQIKYNFAEPPPNGLRISRRLAAFANATVTEAGTDSKTQKSSDLERRKAVGCMRLLARRVGLVHNYFL
jgi:hypothetical protein